MNKHYLSVDVIGDNIYHRYKENGKPYIDVVQPELEYYVSSLSGLKKGLYGETLQQKTCNGVNQFNTIKQEFKDKGKPFYGMEYPVYQFIRQEYPKEIEYSIKNIKVCYFDIETEIGDGFPSPEKAVEAVNAISLIFSSGEKYLLSIYNNNPEIEGVTFIHTKTEKELFLTFGKLIREKETDILSSYNGNNFDIPYLRKRMERYKLTLAILSPYYGMENTTPRQLVSEFKDKEDNILDITIKGIVHLDYMELYKKYKNSAPDNKLQTVVEWELNESKVDYSPYKNLKELYENDVKKFLEYSMHDSLLLKKLNDKLLLIELVVTVAYMAKCKIDDVFHVTKVWDTFLYNDMCDKGLVIPPKQERKKETYVGGYVKPPQIGKHNYVVTFDLTSMYPMIIQQYGISPENKRSPSLRNETLIEEMIEDFSHLRDNELVKEAHKNNHAICANGTTFVRDNTGIIPEAIGKVFDKRVQYKNQSKDWKKEHEKAKAELIKRGLLKST